MPYIFWVSAFNVTYLLCYCLVEYIFYPPSPSKHASVKKEDGGGGDTTNGGGMDIKGGLLESINQNSLVLFLIVRSFFVLLNLAGPDALFFWVFRLGKPTYRFHQSHHTHSIRVTDQSNDHSRSLFPSTFPTSVEVERRPPGSAKEVSSLNSKRAIVSYPLNRAQ